VPTSPAVAAPVTWLTQEAFDRLQNELNSLVAARPDLAAEINARREEGDLRENGGYHAAKEEQGKQEARIRQLEQLLRSARVGEAPSDGGVAGPGMTITVRFAGDEDSETFLLGSREMNATSQLDVYSPESALGAAVLGARAGDEVAYTAPNGRELRVSVVDVKPFTG